MENVWICLLVLLTNITFNNAEANMSRQWIKTRNGSVLGSINENGNYLFVYDKQGKCYGKYDPRNDTTYDTQGRMVGRGNTLTTLLPIR